MVALSPAESPVSSDSRLLVGCYTAEMGGTGTGLTTMVRSERGWEPAAVLPMSSPSWVTAHPSLPVVYATNENAEGTVTAVALDADGNPTALGSRPTGGADPCHLAVVSGGRFLVAANYSGGSVAVFPLGRDGSVEPLVHLVRHHGSGPVVGRQDGPHPHMIVADGPDTLVVVDLGADALVGYRIDAGSGMTEISRTGLPAGTGPRQLVRTGHQWLIAAELSAQLLIARGSAVTGFELTGMVAASARPGPNQPAQLGVAERDGIVLLSNRGPDTVSVFDVTGGEPEMLTETEVGPGWPRHLCLLGDRLLVGLQRADLVREYRLTADGALAFESDWTTGSPTCLLPWPQLVRVGSST